MLTILEKEPLVVADDAPPGRLRCHNHPRSKNQQQRHGGHNSWCCGYGTSPDGEPNQDTKSHLFLKNIQAVLHVKAARLLVVLLSAVVLGLGATTYSLRQKVWRLESQLAKAQKVAAAMSSQLPESCLASYKRVEWDLQVDIVSKDQPLVEPSRRAAMWTVLFLLGLLPFLFYNMDRIAAAIFSRNGTSQPSLSKQVAYRIDVLLSKHEAMKSLALLLATLVLIALGGVALFAVSNENFFDALWKSWTYVADAGNHADSEGLGPRIVSILISFGGLFIFALMLGLVSDTIAEKVDSLRKGKSQVIETNHTLILGWSDKMAALLKQLSIANKSAGGGVVVIMAEREKEDMENDIARIEWDFMGTSVICRSGSPLALADLKKVSVSTARAIIVMAEAENANQSDARALRVVLGLTGVENLQGHIVVELSDLDTHRIIKLVGGDLVEILVSHDVIGRLMIQCARQPGLAQVWEDLLGFDKAEFYTKRWPELEGMQFGDALIRFEDAIPFGVKLKSTGRIKINPPDDYVIQEGDEMLVIAEDDDCYHPGPAPTIDAARCLPPTDERPSRSLEKILLIGWRRDIDDMIMVLDASLARGSEVWMFNEVPLHERAVRLVEGGLKADEEGNVLLQNIQLVQHRGSAVIWRHLDLLPLETFHSILILADEAVEDSIANADSRSLTTLLLIRDIQARRLVLQRNGGVAPAPQFQRQTSWIANMQTASLQSIVISEILDSTTKNLIMLGKISDYVLSNELVSMALAMVAEDKEVNRILEELFSHEGNEIYIRPASLYIDNGGTASFYELMVCARHRKEIMIGYRCKSDEVCVLNPPDKGKMRMWLSEDCFIVISED